LPKIIDRLRPRGPRAKVTLWVVGGLIAVILVGALGYYLTAAALVNGQRVSMAQLSKSTLNRYGADVLDELITNKLIDQEIRKQGITVAAADIDAEVASLKNQYAGGDQATWESVLAQEGVTEAELRETVRRRMAVEQIIGKDITVTDEELQTYYDANKDYYTEPEQVRASEIVVATLEEAQAIVTQLKGGADFAALAKEKSISEYSKENGGDLGYFASADQPADLSKAAFALPVGQISDPIKIDEQYYVIKVADHKATKVNALADIRDQVRKDMVASQVEQKIPEWLTNIKAKAKIVQRWKSGQ
jgi:foldase protein PrsA